MFQHTERTNGNKTTVVTFVLVKMFTEDCRRSVVICSLWNKDFVLLTKQSGAIEHGLFREMRTMEN